MQLFYNSSITESDKEIIFDKEESRHILKVLRKKIGDELHITNGFGLIFKAHLKDNSPKSCVATVQEILEQPPLPYHLHLVVAPTKLNDRYEWFLEKATEIGVSEITPIICEHSERKVIKKERYDRIIQSAMKQSLKAWKPILNESVSFTDFIASEIELEVKLIAHCEDVDKRSLKEVVMPTKSVCILIGPEGDFSSEEIALAKSNGFSEIHLGNSRLRTETAAIVACQNIAFINEN